MFWLLVLACLLLLPFSFFVYATGQGLFMLLCSINWSRRKLWLMAIQVVAVLLLTCNIDTLMGIRTFFRNMVSSSQLLLGHTSDGHALFARHAASSHTICGFMGIVIAAWIKGFLNQYLAPSSTSVNNAKRLPSSTPDSQKSKSKKIDDTVVSERSHPQRRKYSLVLALIMHFLFALGCFLWFRYWVTPFMTWYDPQMKLSVSTYDASFLTFSHVLAFTLGMIIYEDYNRRRLYERNEMEVMQYYTVYYIVFMTLPRLARAGIDHFAIDMVKVWEYTQVYLSSAFSTFLSSSSSSSSSSESSTHPSHSLLSSLIESSGIVSFISSFSSFESVMSWIGSITLHHIAKALYYGMIAYFLRYCYHIYLKLMLKNDRRGGMSEHYDLQMPPVMDEVVMNRVAQYPPPYPSGWYKCFRSHEVPIGRIRKIRMVGQQFAVYRLPNNTTHVCDLHEEFKTAQEYEKAGVRKWHSIECWNIIFVYYTLDKIDTPPYQPTFIPEIDTGYFKYGGFMSRENVDLHIQEVAENAADSQHFGVVHGQMATPILKHLFVIHHRVHFDPGRKDPDTGMTPFGYFINYAALVNQRLGIRVPESVPTVVQFSGPSNLSFRFKTPTGDIIMNKTFQVLGPCHCRMDDEWYYDPNVPPLLANYILNEGVHQFAADIVIWNRKCYLPKPILARGDGPIPLLRRWFRQFYTENSYQITLPPIRHFGSIAESGEIVPASKDKDGEEEKRQQKFYDPDLPNFS